MDDQHHDFYRTLRERVTGWLAKHGAQHRHAQTLLVAPDIFHLLCRLALDKRVASADKAKLAAAIAYFVSPLDVVPELLLGPIGLLDDVAVAAYALNAIINNGQGEIARELWAGDGDVLEIIQRVIASADELLGAGAWKRLRNLME